MTDLLFVITALQLAAAVVATFTFNKYKLSNEKYFLYFLWYTFLVDATGATLGHVFSMKNFWLYNAYTISSFLFYFYWYYTILKNRIFKRTIVAFTFMFLLVAILSLFYQSWLVYHSYTFNTGALFVLVLTLFHFYQLLKSDEVLIVKYKLSFWISTALLLFYMGMIPLFSLSSFIKFRGASYILILLGLNVILYGCYLIGFIWTKKEIQSFLIIFSVILFFLALTVIFLFAIFQKRKNRLLIEQQEAENRFKEEIIETQIEIKEDTLRNVSWELHDNIGQLLTLSKIQMQNAKDDPAAIDQAIETLGTSLNELRSLSKILNQDTLYNLSLVEALQLEIERFNRLRYLDASMECFGTYFSIDGKIEIIIFRMLQEFFTNTIKHSKGSTLKVDITYSGNTLSINAMDNGVGFDESLLKTFKGIGLSNIKNRAKLIGANVELRSKVGEGTRFSLTYKI